MKFADNWLAPNPGSDAAIAQAMTHVILQEHYVNQPNERYKLRSTNIQICRFLSCWMKMKMDIKRVDF